MLETDSVVATIPPAMAKAVEDWTGIADRGKTIIVKMDVEGYEFHSLAGLERTLRENQCYLQIELYSERLDELKTLLAGFGYRFLHTHYEIDHYFTNIRGVE